MKRILITGAGSYIGTSFEAHLRKWPNQYHVDTLDMSDLAWRGKSFSGYDAIYHVAGIAHSDTGKVTEEQKNLYFKVNTDLTIETARKAKMDGAKQFIFMSSAIVYGNSAPVGKKKRITKDTPTAPANFYGESKLRAERGVGELASPDFKVVILRSPMVYGKECKGNYPVLSKLARKLPAFPLVNNERSMLYIGNLVEFVRLMIENQENGIFWPQNAEYSNTSEIVKMIAQVHGKKLPLVRGTAWAIKVLGKMLGLVNKAFGNLSYDQELSEYKENYRLYSLRQSIEETEK